MTADLSALIARLEAAEVGSRELDAHVEVAARAFGAAKTGLAREHWAVWRASSSGIVGDGATQYASAPVTTSLDAALALAERVLPGWTVGCHTADGSQETYPIRKDMVIFDGGDCEFTLSYCHPKIEPREIGVGYSSSPALALCIAILRAKQGEG